MKNSLVLRKVAKHLSYRKRYLSLSSIEQVRLRRLKRLILTVMCKIKTSEEKDELNGKLKKLIVLYFAMTTSMDEGLDRPERCAPTIRSFSASNCKLMFEFKKTDLLRLLPLLHFPDECCFDNRSKMAGSIFQITF